MELSIPVPVPELPNVIPAHPCPAANVLFIHFYFHLFNHELKFFENIYHAHWLRPFFANTSCEIQLHGSRRVGWLRW